MKKLVTLTALTLITLSTPSQASTPDLECSGMPAGSFEVLEVYEAKGGLEVVTQAPGQCEQSLFVPNGQLKLEAAIELPPAGTNARSLEWRHTGFYLATYTEKGIDRTRIDCE